MGFLSASFKFGCVVTAVGVFGMSNLPGGGIPRRTDIVTGTLLDKAFQQERRVNKSRYYVDNFHVWVPAAKVGGKSDEDTAQRLAKAVLTSHVMKLEHVAIALLHGKQHVTVKNGDTATACDEISSFSSATDSLTITEGNAVGMFTVDAVQGSEISLRCKEGGSDVRSVVSATTYSAKTGGEPYVRLTFGSAIITPDSPAAAVLLQVAAPIHRWYARIHMSAAVAQMLSTVE